ncbi:HEAT repeat protein-like protein [Polyplosphaeria fusca]|uniref:HEAT repeat protein-like protein n=1 Tax=Polyplosphaeria fusca TaxID=682080 RepID=A0A9P4V1Q5_9PLEO|nr:HEAT repeat protein-like protein [Polyplosphaeria fusca]
MEDNPSFTVPVPQAILRDLPRNLSTVLPKLTGDDQDTALLGFVGPILDTADLADLAPSHRAAACNALCAVLQRCQDSNEKCARDAALDDRVWLRLLQIYLQRFDGTLRKPMRQILLALTGAILKNHGYRSEQLRDRATSDFLKIICSRKDRMKVRPALQGLAHFLLKGLASISRLVTLYNVSLSKQSSNVVASPQSLFTVLMEWVVHHDTALSAGHAIKNFLAQARRSETSSSMEITLPLWAEPVVQAFKIWPERIQELKTHVFPHCFLPEIEEYLQFLSYLHIANHINTKFSLPEHMHVSGFPENGLPELVEFKLLLAAIQSGKELGCVKDVDSQDSTRIEICENVLCLPDSCFSGWLSNLEPEVRLSGLSLSVYSNAVTRPLTRGVCTSLKSNLAHLHADTDANFRKDVLSHMQRLYDRLRGSTTSLSKPTMGSRIQDQGPLPLPRQSWARKYDPHVSESLFISLQFLTWHENFLKWELRSSAPYQRRISALRCLSIVLRSGLDPSVPHRHLSKSAQGELHWSYGLQISSHQLMRLLFDLLVDPYDDIRDISASLLEVCFHSLPSMQHISATHDLKRFIDRAESIMVQSGRADQADGVARSYALLFNQSVDVSEAPDGTNDSQQYTKLGTVTQLVEKLEETIMIATRDLSYAVQGRPAHGLFAALRYILDQGQFYDYIALLRGAQSREWKNLHQRMCVCVEDLWRCVRDVLCADAPEGHVPEDLDEEASIDTKEVLSYSWRALKEASVLLRTIVSKAPIGTEDASMLDPVSYERLGRECFTQLAELRHRGAFSTVAQTFSAFCRRCFSPNDGFLNKLPEGWYGETQLAIQDKSTSITRRSAGIPSLMVGIIAAEPQPEDKLFHGAMRYLIAEASVEAWDANIQESRLPQVHALNCLKEIFTASRLSAASEAYIGNCLDLAARILNSKVWPIRNCSLMLFKALIERLLGSDEAQDWTEKDRGKTSRFSYEDYPSLAGMLSGLLDPNGPLKASMTPADSNSPMDLHGAEGVFPALQIIRQATPPETHRQSIADRVLHLLCSPHWHLRDMAARTWVSLQLPQEQFAAVQNLLADIGGVHNRQHGILMTLKYMLKRHLSTESESTAQLDAILTALIDVSNLVYHPSSCPATISAFLDVVNTCANSILHQAPSFTPVLASWSRLANSISSISESSSSLSGAKDCIALHRFLILNNLISRVNETQDIAMTAKGTDLNHMLATLAENDPDTCCAILDTVGELARTMSPGDLSASTSSLLFGIYQVFAIAKDPEVIFSAQVILGDCFLDRNLQSGFFSLLEEREIITAIELLQMQWLELSPTNMQSALRLLGAFLDHAYQAYPSHQLTILKQFARYIRLLRMIIVEKNPFDSRFAAIQSISRLQYIWSGSSSKLTAPIVLGLSLVVYDLLNDDDDEIRHTAAIVASNLFQSHGFPTATKSAVPLVTVQRLAKFLISTFTESSDLFNVALRRLGGAPTGGGLFDKGFTDALAEARREDTALFVQEKQNLFRDDTLDMVFWAHILRSLSWRATCPKVITKITAWLLDGLNTLTLTSKNELDGPLGWTSKPEVFTLVMRVICVAEVVMRWNTAEAWKVRKGLRELSDIGVNSDLHPLLLQRLERVLERSVIGVVSAVYRSLRSCRNTIPTDLEAVQGVS